MEDYQIEELREKLLYKLSFTGWDKVLKGFINSSDFETLIFDLYKLKEENKIFTPDFKDVFNAFFSCNYDDLKVVFLGSDPYAIPGMADGLLYSCSRSNGPKPTLDIILNTVNNTVYDGNKEINQSSYDLTRWANQGVLLLGVALTTEVYKIGVHYDIWSKFIAYVLDTLNINNPNIQVVLLGNKAKEYEVYFSDSVVKYTVKHPFSAFNQTDQYWDCEDFFNQINKVLLKNNNTKIIW